MRLFAAFVIATVSGYIALSYEILWVRIYGFLTESPADAFGFLLGSYLAGIAIGAFIARLFCCHAEDSGREKRLYVLGLFTLAANVLGFLVIPVIAAYAPSWNDPEIWSLWIFAAVAALLGTSLPLVAHFGIPPNEKVGARLSYLYLGNILGSAAGSLTTGFWLLDILTLRSLAVFLALLGVTVSGVLILVAPASLRRRFYTACTLIATAVLIVSSSPGLYYAVYEKLLYKSDYEVGMRFAYVYEGKSGIVSVSTSGVVYGGGSYEGQLNTCPLPARDGNRVVRAYVVASFHPDPKQILVIGLGSGSWLQVLVNHPDVRSVTVIEINPGYVELMKRSPVVASVLANPKVEFVIDDGRRFMRRTDRRFDVIVQNTMAYWRAHATNLLSREYLELTRKHLKKGGVVYYNTTAASASHKTGATVFPYVWRFQNMLIASDWPFEIDRERWRRKMLQWQIDGEHVIDFARHSGELEKILYQEEWRGVAAWEDRASILRRTREDPVITDDNMATEWWAYGTYPEAW
ncbi:MAG: methyltransferase domain-containing protein [bacterium]|nr:methyltransferase domain-containing protein [bacterium]